MFDERAPTLSSVVPPQGQAGRHLRSVDLFKGTTEIVIEHYGRLYVLSALPNGDLRLEAMNDPGT